MVCPFPCHCRISPLNVHLLSIEATTLPRRPVVNRATSAELRWSNPALWRRGGSHGHLCQRVNHPSSMQKMTTAFSALYPPCLVIPPLPPLPPPPPLQTPSQTLPLAQLLPLGRRSAAWVSSQRQETWLSVAGGTGPSLSLTLTAASPLTWMTMASAPQTSRRSRHLCGLICSYLLFLNVTGNNSIPC